MKYQKPSTNLPINKEIIQVDAHSTALQWTSPEKLLLIANDHRLAVKTLQMAGALGRAAGRSNASARHL